MCTKLLKYFFVFLFCSNSTVSNAQDTLRVMSYNVLNYGTYPLCDPSRPNGVLHSYLETIVQYANPDIIGLVKTGEVQLAVGNNNYNAPLGFADSIVDFALNTAYPGRYTHCPFTNASYSSTMCLLFYDQQKLGFIAITSSYVNIEDFNTWKLYYKDPNLATTHDTTFLYITLNHDQSGSTNQAIRGGQIAGEMQQIQTHFSHLPNMLNMGDFNTRNTANEPSYQTLVNPSDSNFRFYDPPFGLDHTFAYPADWDNNPASFSAYLSTSTHANVIDQCDVGGGAKDWYDHIFVSPWIEQNANYIQYVPHSYHALGNDGQRLGKSVNATPANMAVPANVANAIYYMSDKYPAVLELAVTYNTTGISPVDPEISLAVNKVTISKPHISIVNPVSDYLTIYVPNTLSGQALEIDCYDALGRTFIKKSFDATVGESKIPCAIPSGVYFVRILSQQDVFYQGTIFKK